MNLPDNNQKFKKTSLKLKKEHFLFLLIALSFFILGWQIGQKDIKLQWLNYRPKITVSNQYPQNSPRNIDFKLFWDVWDLVSKEYVDKKAVDPQKMYYGAIKGMVNALGDPYTTFLPPEEQKATREELGGSFEGVGIQLGFNKEKRLVVIAPLSGTPAEKAGIKAGDIILKIDKKDTINISLPEAVSLIRGKKGTNVSLEVFHEGDDKTKEVSLTRDTIIVKSVEYQTKNTSKGKKIAYLKVTRFGEKTNNEWLQGVSEALANSPTGVIVDLRNNPGGFLEGSIFITSEFISSGDVVLQENARGERQNYRVNRRGKLLDIPLVVLINKGSASASEIVAGAMQDHGRGKLVGEQSFGKGTIQQSHDLPNSTGVHVTNAKWLTPDGHWIHDNGLTPDVKIELDDDPAKDEQLEKALEMLN